MIGNTVSAYVDITSMFCIWKTLGIQKGERIMIKTKTVGSIRIIPLRHQYSRESLMTFYYRHRGCHRRQRKSLGEIHNTSRSSSWPPAWRAPFSRPSFGTLSRPSFPCRKKTEDRPRLALFAYDEIRQHPEIGSNTRKGRWEERDKKCLMSLNVTDCATTSMEPLGHVGG